MIASEVGGKLYSGNELISVIMGVYNCDNEEIVARCMNSIIRQTYENWELIVCDDGSEDGTIEVLKRWASKDARIHLIRNPKNRTLAPTLNRCIRMARGAYIARMDIDDWAERNRFAVQIAFLKEHPQIDFCGSDVMLFDEIGDWGIRSHPEHPKNRDFLKTVPFVHPSIMARRTLYEKYTYSEDRFYYKCEDYELFARAYAGGMKGANIQKPLLHYSEERRNGKKMTVLRRIKAVGVRTVLFRKLQLFPTAAIYIWKPLAAGLIPQKVVRRIKREGF